MTAAPTRVPKKILVVDDSSLMRQLITEIVESDPELRVVDVAENGRIALQKVREHKPDAILLDLEMPELSGLDTVRHLGLRSPAKVVILSHLGHEGPLLRAEALRLGAVDVIDKPTGAGSRNLRNTRGSVIRQTLRRALGLPVVEGPDEQLPPTGASATASMLSVDVQDLASLCERVDAATLVELFNEHLQLVEKVMRKHDGLVDAHVGGATLTAFGIPHRRADHAARAVVAAGELLATLAARPAERQGAGGAAVLDVGITIVTGVVFAGELGPPRARRYRTMGGASEQAARLGRLTAGYGAALVICERTLGGLATPVATRRLDIVQLDPDSEPVTLYEVLSSRAGAEAGAHAAYAQGMALYEAGHFVKAMQAFDQALQQRPLDRAAARLHARCRALLRASAAGWRGVWPLDGTAG